MANENAFSRILNACKIQASDVIPDIEYAGNFNGCTIEGVTDTPAPAFPYGGIVGVKGQAKSGKSTFVQIAVASILGNLDYGISPIKKPQCVYMFDTEQMRKDTHTGLLRVLKLSKAEEDKIKAFNIRKLSCEERFSFFFDFMETISDDEYCIVVLDGISDLMQDINNNIESSNVMNAILKTMDKHHNCCLVLLLHQNPNADENGKMRGVIGTSILNKCDETWSVKTDGNTFTATKATSRHSGQSQPINFYFDENGNVKSCARPIKKEDDPMIKKWENLAIRLTRKNYSYTQLLNEIMESEDAKISTAKTRLRKYEEYGFVKKNGKFYVINQGKTE